MIFVIRTRCVPFLRSRPSRAMVALPITYAAIGAILQFARISHVLGFASLPLEFILILVAMIAGYLVLADAVRRASTKRRTDLTLTAPPGSSAATVSSETRCSVRAPYAGAGDDAQHRAILRRRGGTFRVVASGKLWPPARSINDPKADA